MWAAEKKPAVSFPVPRPAAGVGANSSGYTGNGTIPQLFAKLKSTFQREEFDRLQQVFMEREENAKKEVEIWRSNYYIMEKKHGESVWEKLMTAEALKDSKRECDELKERLARISEEHRLMEERERMHIDREKRAEERYNSLLVEFDKLRVEKKEMTFAMACLENDKCRAEAEVQVWKKKVMVVEGRVSKLELDIEMLLNMDPPLKRRVQEELEFETLGSNKGNVLPPRNGSVVNSAGKISSSQGVRSPGNPTSVGGSGSSKAGPQSCNMDHVIAISNGDGEISSTKVVAPAASCSKLGPSVPKMIQEQAPDLGLPIADENKSCKGDSPRHRPSVDRKRRCLGGLSSQNIILVDDSDADADAVNEIPTAKFLSKSVKIEMVTDREAAVAKGEAESAKQEIASEGDLTCVDVSSSTQASVLKRKQAASGGTSAGGSGGDPAFRGHDKKAKIVAGSPNAGHRSSSIQPCAFKERISSLLSSSSSDSDSESDSDTDLSDNHMNRIVARCQSLVNLKSF